MNEQKNYAKGIFCKEVTFKSGGSMMNLSINVEAFKAWLDTIKDEKGMAKVNVSKLREVNKYGNTHCAWQNTWKPQQKQQDGGAGYKPVQNEPATVQPSIPATTTTEQPDDLPF